MTFSLHQGGVVMSSQVNKIKHKYIQFFFYKFYVFMQLFVCFVFLLL